MRVSSGWTTVIAVVVGLAVLSSCLENRRGARLQIQEDAAADAAADAVADSAAGASERAEVAAEAVAGTTYADQGMPYGCTDDCSGHEAGYRWAEDHEINDPSDCGGNSQSFIEGCEARAEAYEEALEEASEEPSED